MKEHISSHKKVLRPLIVVSSIAMLYLTQLSGLESDEFWNPLVLGYWVENGVYMPDVEFIEKLFKFLLNNMD